MAASDRWEEIAEELGSFSLGVSFQTQPDMVRAVRLGGPGGIYRPGEFVETEPACKRIAEHEARVEELLAALRPFGNIAKHWDLVDRIAAALGEPERSSMRKALNAARAVVDKVTDTGEAL